MLKSQGCIRNQLVGFMLFENKKAITNVIAFKSMTLMNIRRSYSRVNSFRSLMCLQKSFDKPISEKL
jgi:hypothetical protein